MFIVFLHLFAETLRNPVPHSTSELHCNTYVSVSASFNNQDLLRVRELLVRAQSHQLIIIEERTFIRSLADQKLLDELRYKTNLAEMDKAIIANA